MGEAVNQAETLRRFHWRDGLSFAGRAVAAVPEVIATGWRTDTLRRGLFVPALLGAGVGVYFALPFEPAVMLALVAPLAIAAWLVAAVFGNEGPRVVLACVAAASIGLALAIVRAQTVDTVQISSETRMLTITARVERSEPADKGRTRLWLNVFKTAPALAETPQRVRVSITKMVEPIAPGDWIELRARLRPLPDPVAPGAFDFGRKLWFEGLGAVGFSIAPAKRIAPPRQLTTLETLSDGISRFRRTVSDRIMAVMSPRAGPIAAAFLTGERGLISDEDNEAMRDSSLAHLLSISGLHMALAGFGFFATLRLIFALLPNIALNYPVKKWAAAAALVASAAYLLLSGASVPTQRSFVMIAVALVAMIFDRTALSMRTVAVAAAVVLIVTPEAWMDPSFQMSFAAVVALIAAFEWWTARKIPDAEPPGVLMRAVRMVAAGAATSMVAGIATAPFAAYHFNRFADYGVAANVMVMPIVSFVIMPAGVLALLLMPFGLESWPLAVMGEGIDAMLSVAHWVAAWPGATQAVGAWPMESLALIVVGGLWIAVWQASWRWLGAFPIVAGLGLALWTAQPDVLIAADGDNVGVRGVDGRLHLLSSRRGRFDAEIWLRRDGDPREIADLSTDDPLGFTCDAVGCVAEVLGDDARKIAVAWNREALLDDCSDALIIVDLTRGWHPPCDAAKLAVTRRLLQAEGAITAQIAGGAVQWTSVARERGDRPWSRLGKSSTGERARPTGPAP